ncbi:MAG: ABC transporter permease [Vicinamibacterales bacterium]
MDWKSRVRSAFDSETCPEDDVLEELSEHAERLYQKCLAEGCSLEEAEANLAAQLEVWRGEAPRLQRVPARRAAVVLPSPTSASPLAGVWQDVRFAARLMRRQRAFSLLAIVTVALGIAATTTLFSVARGVIFDPLPWPEPDRIVRLLETRGGRSPDAAAPATFTNRTFAAWRANAATLDSAGAWSSYMATLSSVGGQERVRIARATAGLFSVLRARPLRGTLYTEANERAGSNRVAVISENLWSRRFGGSDDAVNQMIQLGDAAYRIVGVLPADTAFPDDDTMIWIPLFVSPTGGQPPFHAIGRLRAGVSPEQASAEGTARGRAFPGDMMAMVFFGSDGPVDVAAIPLLDHVTSRVRPAIVIFLCAVGLLLVAATANVASLQIARGASRRREIAVRIALGAGSGRVMRQLTTESLMLGFAGGAVGVALTALAIRALPAVLPPDFPRQDNVALDAVVLGFAACAAVLSSLVFGILPAMHAPRLDVAAGLGASSRTATGRDAGRSPVRAVAMTAQVAVASVLLIGAALLAQSFRELLAADRGFDPSRVLTARLILQDAGYTPAGRAEAVDHVLQRLKRHPDIRYAGVATHVPLTPRTSSSAFKMRGSTGQTIEVQAARITVSPGYFEAMGMRFSSGHGLQEADTAASLPVVVVNQAFASRYLDDTPVGEILPVTIKGRKGWHVAGVVEDQRSIDPSMTSGPAYFVSYRQTGNEFGTVVNVVLQTSNRPEAVASDLRTVVRDLDPALALEGVMTMNDRLRTGLAAPRLYAILLGSLAASALIVAIVGLFGVLSYAVSQRSHEIGVRAALGATPRQIVRLVVRQAAAITLTGLTAGVTISLMTFGYISTLLYGVRPYDARTFLLVGVGVLAAAVLAAIVPARRAARIDPLVALRAE